MTKLIMTGLAAAALMFSGCETRREEEAEKGKGVGGAGLQEEPGEEAVFEKEPPEESGAPDCGDPERQNETNPQR